MLEPSPERVKEHTVKQKNETDPSQASGGFQEGIYCKSKHSE